MNIIHIEDPQDSRVDIFSRFSDSELKRGWSSKGPIEQGPLFVAESQNVIERALDGGVRPAAIFSDEKWLKKARGMVEAVASRYPDVPVFATSSEVFKQVTGYSQVRGILAAMLRPMPRSAEEILLKSNRIAILENIGNYTNIGAIFRSAAALGLDAVLATPSCHDPLYRRAARVSMGTVFQVPWAYIGEAPDNASDEEKEIALSDWTAVGLPLLRKHGFKTAALALCDDSISIDDPRLQGCHRLAMVLGTEGDGLACNTIAQCDWTVRIPMAHGVDSLNVAAASAVAFWELRRR